ncbi:uncharacterized protein LOC129609205 [Condylostylus longicornis]|uniref:uncharacterized protein LOC129609205 n=1 Tax=Condylostylus longicornis TaxID=2530218 RepID=UPI00244DB30A|nr:uncharacterized protein LOC129609205 [Condylostylus longicornis]
METRKLLNCILIVFAAVIKTNLCDVCEIKGWGFHCDGCSKMVYCIKPIGADWITEEIGQCDENKNLYCNELYKNCSSTKNCSSNDVTEVDLVFNCKNEGIFPNPYDCKTYFICSKDSKSSSLSKDYIKCPDGYAFNPMSNLCNERYDNNELCKRQYKCNAVYDIAAWPTNNNIFYVCKEGRFGVSNEKFLYPELYSCEPDKIFDNQLQKCASEDEIIATTTNQNNESTATPTPSPTECLKGGIFEDPNNCRGYIYCTFQLRKILKLCPNNSHFNKTLSACVPGSEC